MLLLVESLLLLFTELSFIFASFGMLHDEFELVVDKLLFDALRERKNKKKFINKTKNIQLKKLTFLNRII
jgi:hypothetical protein